MCVSFRKPYVLHVSPPRFFRMERHGPGGTLIFSRAFLGFKILNFNIFGGFQRNDYFGGMKILWIFFGVITKLDYI